MRRRVILFSALVFVVALSAVRDAHPWVPLAVENDPLVRMPGTQPHQGVNLQEPIGCISCHGENTTDLSGNTVVPGTFWSGSMMAQAARDPIFWAAMTVAGQDSIWALGNPNAVDICERCHFPEGWLGGRSDPPNASLMTGSDFDGVHCDLCHRMWNPFFSSTYDGTREGSDWMGYWDEASSLSQTGVNQTNMVDQALSSAIDLFSGGAFFVLDEPKYSTYVENSGGQYFVDTLNGFVNKRASFADTVPDHTVLYSRYHKSKYFCSTCHDVSNPVLANLGLSGLPDQPGGDQISEQYTASRYFHVERTFSEFIISAYGQQGGASTNLEYQMQGAPAVPWAATCQDCHMRDVTGKGCGEVAAPLRPGESVEHPNSGAPLHDLQGGNLWMTRILASVDDHFPATYDQVNFDLLTQGPTTLTLNMYAGISPTDNGDALLAASERARQQLLLAATIKRLSYDNNTGNLSFRVLNNTGHKLISGFPEGRRMFANVRLYDGNNALIFEVNPYDATVGTLKGLSHPSSPMLGQNEAYVEELVYETHPSSTLTGENETFHFVLADGLYKDNRIPPKGFDIVQAADRESVPAWHGVADPNYFSTAEYAGGYDDVTLSGVLPAGGSSVEVVLYYQGTSREYIEFLRDEINGTAASLSSPAPSGEQQAYIIQTDPFFAGLKAWGDTIWNLWYHNHGLDGLGVEISGIVPFEMTSATAMAPATDTIGTYIGGYWFMDNGDGFWGGCGSPGQDMCGGPFGGIAGDVPVAGDWDGDGLTEMGVYRGGSWFLDWNGNGVWDGDMIDLHFASFGGAQADVPIVGNWDGISGDEVGVFRRDMGLWFLDNGNGSWDGCGALPGQDLCVGPLGGLPTDVPVAGDWDGVPGDEIGVFRQDVGLWFLDNGNGSWDGCGALPGQDLCAGPFGGLPTDLPVVGNWDAVIGDEIGIFRNDGSWFLDSGNFVWDNCVIDDCLGPFGAAGQQPVAGAW